MYRRYFEDYFVKIGEELEAQASANAEAEAEMRMRALAEEIEAAKEEDNELPEKEVYIAEG